MDQKFSATENHSDFRVLLTSIGRKVPLLSAVRQALQRFTGSGQVFGGDSDPNCLGRYFVDQFAAFPTDAELEIDWLLDRCRGWRINAIIPTRDQELLFYARHRELLAEAGIGLMVSDPDAVAVCLDKLNFADRLTELGFPEAIPTSTELEAIEAGTYVVKERLGAGARSILLDSGAETARAHATTLQQPVFQPYVKGQEFSIDLYLDRTNRPLGAIARSRDFISNGEAQISTTVKNSRLEELCCEVAGALGLSGHLVFQALIDCQEQIHLIECNCRFGGASTLSLSAGLESLLWFFCEASGQNPRRYPFRRHPEQLRQIRYPADLLVEVSPQSSGGAGEP